MFFTLLFKSHHLLCQRMIGCCHLAFGIVSKNALAFRADFRGADGMRNGRGKHFDFAAVGFAQQGRNFTGICCADIYHGQQDAVNLQLGVNLPPYFGDGLQKLL